MVWVYARQGVLVPRNQFVCGRKVYDIMCMVSP
jgi:hypothetical protein